MTLTSASSQKRTVKYGRKTIQVDLAAGKARTLHVADFK